MNERFSVQNQIEHHNHRYTGTGHADTTKWEYGTTLKRDALSSHISHFSRLLYFSAVENQSMTRIKNRMIEDMVQPCGPPPPKKKKG